MAPAALNLERSAPILLVLGGLVLPAWANSGPIVLIKSKALPGYEAQAAAFHLAEHDAIVDLTLGDGTVDEVARRAEALRPDVIVAIGLKAAMVARDRFPRMPIVFAGIASPDRYDLAGPWITGVVSDVTPQDELAGLRAVAPGLRRVALFHGPATPASWMRAAQSAAAAGGITLVDIVVTELDRLATLTMQRASDADALWLPADAQVATPESFRFLLERSLSTGKPLLAFSDVLVRAGALVAVTPDYAAAAAHIVERVRRIRSGERPGDIPIARLHDTRLVVNRTTARALGREIRPDLATSAEILP